VELLDLVRSGSRPADGVVRDFFRSRRYLGSSDRRYIAERLFDVLRHVHLLTVLSRETLVRIAPRYTQTSLPSIMLLAAWEARLSQEPHRDRVPEFEGEWRMEVPDVDCSAFLDGIVVTDLPGSIKADECLSISFRHSIPAFIIRDWIDSFGVEQAEALAAASNGTPPVTIRVNTIKCSVTGCREALQCEGVSTTPTQHSPFGLILPRRLDIQRLSAFRRGWFEIQDEGSQLVSLLMEVRPGMTVVDACAGGGGKSLLIASLMENTGSLHAVDIDKLKLENFLHRCRRAGVTIASVETTEEVRSGPLADAVLVDAPCSGIGTLRRNPWMKLRLSEEMIDSCSSTQRALLERNALLVRPGGRLVYVTCTILRRENQDVIEEFLHQHSEFSMLRAGRILNRQGIPWDENEQYLELLPHRYGTDGFFAAVLVRNENAHSH
jgi:16S rRNA (cytosine967-C5)-methyltransferase